MWNRIPNRHTNSSERFFHFLVLEKLTENHSLADNHVIKSVWNIPKFKDRANWSRDTFQPMRRRACVYQNTNQNINMLIKTFHKSGQSRTESVVVSRLSGIFQICM